MPSAAPIMLQADQHGLGGLFSSKNKSSWGFSPKKRQNVLLQKNWIFIWGSINLKPILFSNTNTSVTCFPSERNTRSVQNFIGKELAHQIIDWASEQTIKPGWNYVAKD